MTDLEDLPASIGYYEIVLSVVSAREKIPFSFYKTF